MLIKRLVVGALQANCYILVDEPTGSAAVIDPGDDAPAISRIIKESGAKLTHILLTHAHPDHSFAAGALQEDFSDAALLVHEAETDQVLAEILDLVAQFYDMDAYKPLKPAGHLIDEDLLAVGSSKLKVIYTPGHSPGGVGFQTGNVVFTGDTLFAGGIGRTDFPGGSYEKLMESIHTKLLALPDETVIYPGHGPESTIGVERESNPWIVESG